MLDVSSPTSLIDIGIAQGSCVGHFMFLFYMNDIVRFLIAINFLIYADDTTPSVSGVDIGQSISIMSQCLTHMYLWLYINKTRLNVSKTNYVKINRSKQINLNVLPSINLRNAALERKEKVKFLGVHLYEGLN